MILVDTGPLVALLDPRDEHFQRARRDLLRLQSRELWIVVPVLTETLFHLRRPLLRRKLRALLAEPLFRVVELSRPMVDSVLDWLDRYADHSPDFADAVLAVLCGERRDTAVWTYDAEFRTIWRRPNGSRIPLAAR
jgi:uncharacterized protein